MFAHRSMLSDDACHAGIEAFRETVTTELAKKKELKRKLLDFASPRVPKNGAAAKNGQAKQSPIDLIREDKLRKFRESKSYLYDSGPRAFTLTAKNGASISVPPYDLKWTSEPFWDEADNTQGTFKVLTADSLGYQAAGVGLFLSTLMEEEVRLSTMAFFHTEWSDLLMPAEGTNAMAASDGGVGVLVYEGGNVVARNDADLWTDTQIGNTLFQGNSGDKFLTLTDTSAADTYFHMIPGRQYLAWIWAWASVGILGNALAIAKIEANIPFVFLSQAGR